MRSHLAIFCSLVGTLAIAAVPSQIDQQGRILKSDGTPETGALSATFAIYDSASGGAALWTEAHALPLDGGGYYSVSLGAVTPFPNTLFDGRTLYLGIKLSSEQEMTPREPILSAPYAMVAGQAHDVIGDIHPASITVNGKTIVDSQGRIVLDAGCTTGQILAWDGSNFACVSPSASSGGTVTSVTAGAGLAGGTFTSAGTLSIATGGVTNAMLQNSGVTVTPGAGLTGGGAVSLGGSTKISLRTDCSGGQLLAWSGTDWACTSPAASSGGTVTSVIAGAGLSGGTINSTGTLSIASGGVTNAMLQNSSVTVTAGTGLSGGGTVALGGTVTLAATAVAPSGTVLDLEFEDNTGLPATFLDSSGLGNTATGTSGFAPGSSGHSGKGVNFSGGVLTIAGPTKIPDSAQVSVEAWINPTTVNTTKTIFQKGTTASANAHSYTLRLINQNASFTVSAGIGTGTDCTATASDSSVPVTTWSNVSGWYDGQYAVVAVNGTVRATAACSNGSVLGLGPVLATPTGAFSIGATTTGTQTFAGTIDEVRVRNTAVSAVRVQSVYTQWGVGTCTNGAQTLNSGFAFGAHYTHNPSGEPSCLAAGAPGPVKPNPSSYGDIKYGMSVQGTSPSTDIPSSVVNGVSTVVIVKNTRLKCASCGTPKSSCFRIDGTQTCPAGFTSAYAGFLFGGYYVPSSNPGHNEPVCIDGFNYDGSAANLTDNGAYVYPTSVESGGGTGVTAGTFLQCAVCCAN